TAGRLIAGPAGRSAVAVDAGRWPDAARGTSRGRSDDEYLPRARLQPALLRANPASLRPRAGAGGAAGALWPKHAGAALALGPPAGGGGGAVRECQRQDQQRSDRELGQSREQLRPTEG